MVDQPSYGWLLDNPGTHRGLFLRFDIVERGELEKILMHQLVITHSPAVVNLPEQVGKQD